ncbi:MAG: sigma-70 family RNA polymerase sigma factor [Myxococcota bacterium]
MDSSLVERAQAGDRDAMEHLLEVVAPQAYRFGLRMCRHPDDAEEVAQETLLSIAQNLGGFEQRASLSSWVYALARTACARRRRGLKNRPMEPAASAPEPVAEGASPEHAVTTHQVAERIGLALDRLPEDYREVLVLRDMEGLTAPEAADALGVSVGALKSRLHRARAALRQELRPLLEPGSAPAAACPDVAEVLSKKLEGDLAAADCTAMEAHLERCPPCRTGCEALQRALAACRSHAKDTPLPPDLDRRVREAARAWLEGPE